jgi:hypothetical protein
VVKWRDLAKDGQSYAQIARRHPQYTADQVRHYCLGNTGRKLPGPLQEPHRWNGHNVWLQGESSPHAELSRDQVLAILNDWDEDAGDWATSGAEWARRLGVSPSTIHMLRRGETWEHLNHPNQGRREREREARARGAAPTSGAHESFGGANGRRRDAVHSNGGHQNGQNRVHQNGGHQNGTHRNGGGHNARRMRTTV